MLCRRWLVLAGVEVQSAPRAACEGPHRCRRAGELHTRLGRLEGEAAGTAAAGERAARMQRKLAAARVERAAAADEAAALRQQLLCALHGCHRSACSLRHPRHVLGHGARQSYPPPSPRDNAGRRQLSNMCFAGPSKDNLIQQLPLCCM